MKRPCNTKIHRQMLKMKSQKGFGLVELMISLVLGMLLIGGVLSIFLSNQQTFRSNEGLSRLQENARISFELMAREVRQAGGNPCGAKLVGNVVNNASTTWSLNWEAGTVIGFAGTHTVTAVTTGTATANRATATDAIQVLSGNLGDSASLASNSTTTAQITLTTSTHSITATDIVMVCDGSSAAIAQVSSVSGTALYHVSATGTPGNCSQGLGYPSNCATAVGTSKTFQPGGFVSDYSASTWYVGFNSRGGRSLFRIDINGTEEIAEGVTDMDIAYLLRTEATGALDSNWVDASSITDWTPTAAKQVVAVRMKLTLETLAKVGTNQQKLERQLIHVVSLRNRSL